MNEDEFVRIGVKLNTIWPAGFKAELMAEWHGALMGLAFVDVCAAIDLHHREISFKPTLAEVLSRVNRSGSAQRNMLVTRTSDYLTKMRGQGESAAAERKALRDRLDRLPFVQRLDLQVRALAKLDEEMPALAAHFYAKQENSDVVLATMVALLGNQQAGDLAA